MKNLKLILSLVLILTLTAGASIYAAEASTAMIKKTKTTLYTDISDYTVYYELTEFLHLDRLYRRLFNKKVHAQDINIYDEVADSAFFENRHGRSPLSTEALEKGYAENDGPSPEGPITVTKGKTEGLHPGFFIEDARGDKYLLKFDPVTNWGLNTSAEVIASRFYYAIGYNVPQYTIFTFDPERMVPSEKATAVDRTGFKKKLTPELLQQFLIQLPRDEQGRLRASASKILKGENKGAFSFVGKRKEDPADTILHERRRAIRALRVFASWLNNNDVRRQNTLDMWVTEDGKSYLKHFLIDFNSALGGAAGGPKPPMFTHEYMVDYGEITKNMAGLGFRESDWQKRWKDNGEKENESPAQGYLDNHYFFAEKYKIQLPNYAVKDLTRADGFWAAKIIMTFTDDDLRAMIKAGELPTPEDAEFIFNVLAGRRQAIGQYWFSKSSPLDRFELKDGRLSFSDLEVHYGFTPAEGSIYSVEGIAAGKKGRRLGQFESATPELDIPAAWLEAQPLTLLLKVKRPGEKKPRPYVLVEVSSGKITRVLHQD